MRPDGVTLDNWQNAPANRWAFQHVDEVVTTAVVSRGDGLTTDLIDARRPLTSAADEFLDNTCTDGFLVLRGREIVAERYFNVMTESTRHLFMSVSKSLCSAVFGQFVVSGQIDVTVPVPRYIPELADSAYGDATVQEVLDMTVAVEFDETYDDPASEVQTEDRVAGWRSPRVGDPTDTYEFLATLRKSGVHGAAFSYCSANTDVLAWILERVTGGRYAELLSARLWSKIGVEHDAYVTVDGSGFPSANGGVCGTLRDLARFGRLVLDGGADQAGVVVIPAAWIADVRRGGNRAAAEETMRGVHPNGSYRNQFWISGDDDGSFYGVGIHGQYVWMNPTTDVVIVKLSSLPQADATEDWSSHIDFFRAVSELVR